MHLFLDTANIDEIRKAARLGVVSGVTTNPSLISKEGKKDYKSAVKEIAGIIKGPISVEVISQEPAGMIAEARDLASWAPNIVIKIPVTATGLESISVLVKEKININMTLCFSVNQALLGAAAGVAYVSPFVGRLDDIGEDGMQLVAEIVKIYRSYNFKTRVIAASIRHPMHCLEAARAGADIATVPFKVLMQMLDHPLTTIGIARFQEDWNKLKL